MATSSQPEGPSDECPPYRSFQELRGDPTVAVVFSPAAKRLVWPLDGVFPTTLSVMKTPRSVDDFEPYFQQTLSVWHEIAQLPLTEPKVSSVEASVYDLGRGGGSLWSRRLRAVTSSRCTTTLAVSRALKRIRSERTLSNDAEW